MDPQLHDPQLSALPYDIWRKGQIDNFTRSDFDLRYTGEEAPPLIITHASNSTNYSGIEFPASGWSAALEVSELVRYRASAWEAGLCTPSTGSFTAGSGTPFLDTVNLALPGSKSLLVGLGNSIAVVTGLGKTEKINWFDGHVLSKAEEFDAKFLNVTAVGGALVESAAASAGKLLLKGVPNNLDNVAAPGPVNFMADSDRFFINASKRPDVDPDGYFDVVAHGSPNKIQIETPNGPVLVDHRTAAKLIEQQPGYNGQNIRLFSCSTGACDTGFAQNLANKLNVEVQAPTDLLWAYPNGKTLVAPKALNGQPDLSNIGEIKIFLPKKSQ